MREVADLNGFSIKRLRIQNTYSNSKAREVNAGSNEERKH
jgi:hypothetical protein